MTAEPGTDRKPTATPLGLQGVDWPVTRLGALFLHVDERSTTGDERLLSITKRRGVVPRDILTDDPPRADTLIGYKRCKAGDLVVNQMSIYDGLLGVSAWEGIVTYHYLVFRPIRELDPRYFAYLLMSYPYRSDFATRVRGLGESTQANVRTPHIRISDVLQTVVPLPPLAVQRAVADHLDQELARLDSLAHAKHQLVGLLRERRTALVVRNVIGSHALHDGDDPGPESVWRKTRVKRVLRKLNRRARENDGVVTAFRDGEVTLRSSRREEGYTFSATEGDYQGVEPGDLVFHGLDGFAGAIGVCVARGKCPPIYHVCQPEPGYDTRFIAYALRSLGDIGFLAVQAGNVRQRAVDFRNWEKLGQIPLSCPSLESQRLIADRLDRETQDLDELISRIEIQVRLLDEHRDSLITAAVTGELDVGVAA